MEAVTAPTKSVEQQPEAEEKKVDAPVSVFHKLGMRLRKKATVAEKESNFGESEEKAAQGKAADQVAQGKAAEQTATVPATEVEPATTAATTTTTAGEVVSSEVQVESEGTKNGSGTSIFHKLSKRFKKKTASKPEEKPAEKRPLHHLFLHLQEEQRNRRYQRLQLQVVQCHKQSRKKRKATNPPPY